MVRPPRLPEGRVVRRRPNWRFSNGRSEMKRPGRPDGGANRVGARGSTAREDSSVRWDTGRLEDLSTA